jgi:hypothetical protein
MIAVPPGIVSSSLTSAVAEPVPVPVPVVPPPPPIDALDDRTRVAPPRKSRGSWRLALPDGSGHPLAGTTVLGRQPDVGAFAGASETLTIDDPDGLVSKSHAVLVLDSGRLSIRDLGSTNGVVVLAADGSEIEVKTDASTPLDDGFEIELGSFVIRIEKA